MNLTRLKGAYLRPFVADTLGMTSRMRSQHDKDQRLGPDSMRRQFLSRLRETVEAAPASQPPPFAFPEHAPPEMPSIAVGNAIDLVDNIRILQQYARVVSQACRGGESQMGQFLAGQSLPPQLAWFEPLRAPVRSPVRLQPTFERQLRLFRSRPGHAPPADPSAGDAVRASDYYAMQQVMPFVDLGLVRHLLSLGRPESTEYEARVSCHLLRLERGLSWPEHLRRLDSWRETSLLHPLLLAAASMPTLNDWLPVDMHNECAPWGDVLTEINGARSAEELGAALESLDSRIDWAGPAGLAIAGLLDRLAVAMRVLSNAPAGDSCSLDDALARFPDWSEATPPSIWKGVREALERTMPPSLLCVRMSGFRRGTWSYEALTPVYDGTGVRFAERALEWVEPFEAPRAGSAGEPSVEKDRVGARLQDVLCRMGEIALRPEMGHAMMLALDGLDYLHKGSASITENEHGYCRSPPLLLRFMSNAHRLASEDEDVNEFLQSLFARLPEVRCVRAPVHIVGWRVDPPSRVVVYTGKIPGRRLCTALLDERSCASSVGGIFSLPVERASTLSLPVRKGLSGSMLGCLRGLLSDPLMETLRVDQNRRHTHTALPEGLGEMALRESLLHTTVPLHSSMRWDNEREDARYSETQAGSNGQRMRDWLAVHRDPANPQKCRLDSHSVVVDHFYCTMFPWRREDGSSTWVDVAASVQPEVRVLPLRRKAAGEDSSGSGRGGDPLSLLLTSVKARFLQDLKLLPVRDPAHRTERCDTSIYVDRQNGQVLICYAPTGDPQSRIEFMAFGLRR